MPISTWLHYLATLTLAATVALIGEPRPVALTVAALATITATTRICRELDQ